MGEEQKRKLRTLGYRFILAALIVITGYIFYRSIFHINGGVTNLSIYNSLIKTTDLKPIPLLVGMLVYIGGISKLYRIFCKPYFNEKRTWYLGVSAVVVFFIALLVYSNQVTVDPTYDLSHIKRTIYATMTGNEELKNNYYYNRYPNNIALLLLVRAAVAFGNLLRVENISIIGNFLGSITLAVTALFAFLTAKKVYGNSMALLVAVLFLTNPLFYLYSSYYYTDVMSMPFSMVAIYLFACFWKSKQHSKDYWKLIAAGVSIGIGYKVRATVVILLLAMLLWTFTRAKLKTTAKVLLILVLGMAPAFIGFKALYATNVLASDKNSEFPISHWLMMGLNEASEGKYNGEDFRMTSSYKTYEEKVSFNSEEIIKRIKAKGIKGLYEHSKEKLAIVWSDGYGIPSTFRNAESYNHSYDYSIGTRSIFLRYYAQICRCSLFALLFLYFVSQMAKKEPLLSVLDIALLGAFVFYLLWEANERYSVSFLPWILLIMAEGVRLTEQYGKSKVFRYKERQWKIPTKWIGRSVAGMVLAATCFFMVSRYDVYTKQTHTYTDTAYLLPRGKIKVRDMAIGKKKFRQEFSTSRTFNQIELLVNGKACKTLTNYIVSLRQEGKEIRKMSFTSDQVRRKSSITLRFAPVSPKESTVYTVVIRSQDASNKDTVKLTASYHCDEIAHKALTVNGEQMERNLGIHVMNTKNRTYTSVGIYLGLCIVALGIEGFVFAYVFQKKKSEENE